jgi:lysophospholipase L1-like esterase
MIGVARKFTGRQGMIVCMGDSITYANQSTRWAWAAPWNRKGQYTDADKAILRWSHAYDQNKPTNGWWLAKVDRPGGRSETAASGIRTDQYIRGGFHGLPSLAAILKKHNPQVAFILLGTNDARGRKPADVLKDMNTILEAVLGNGTIPVLTTLPPARSARMHDNIRACNRLYLGLAAARKIPVIDLYGEMVSRRPGGAWQGTLVGRDGVHLTHKLAEGPPTTANLANCGYLLRCWLTVQKLKEVKQKVIDKK